MRLISEGAKFAANARRSLGQTQQRRGLGGYLLQANAAITLPANYWLKGIGGGTVMDKKARLSVNCGGIIYRKRSVLARLKVAFTAKKNRHLPQQRPMLAELRERFATG